MGAPSPSSSLDLKNYQKSSSFFRRLAQRVRLSLTDVTVPQLVAKEITSRGRQMPETRIMKSLSKAAFEIDDYWRIVKILHTRFKKFDMKNWMKTYKALVLLEHLLMYGPKSSRKEFETDGEFIKQLRTFQYIDEQGYNWGQSMKEKAESVLKMIDHGPHHADVSGHMQGHLNSTSIKGVVEVSDCYYGRGNTNFEPLVLHGQKEDLKHDAVGTQETSIDMGSIAGSKNDQFLEEWEPLLAGEDDADAALPVFNTKSWVVFT